LQSPISDKSSISISLVAMIVLGTVWAIRLEARADRVVKLEEIVEKMSQDVVDIKVYLGVPPKRTRDK